MYENQAQNNNNKLKEQPYISLQKLGENKFVRGITTLVGVIGGIIGAYQIAKTINSSYSPEVDAADIQKNLNNTKSIGFVLTEEQAEKTTVNHNSKIEQLYEKIVSPYIKDMSDSERKAMLIKILNRHQNDSESDITSTTVDPCAGVTCTGGTVTMTDTICLLGGLYKMTVIAEELCGDGTCRWKQVDAYTEYMRPCDTTLEIKQLYNKMVSQYIKDMPDIQLRSKIATLAHRRGIDTTKSQRYSILNFNDYLF